jgi:hypothetical protein
LPKPRKTIFGGPFDTNGLSQSERGETDAVDTMALVVFAIVVLLAAGAGLYAVYRSRAQFRESLALRRRAKALSRERRRDLARALRGGRAVRDPRDAALAADLAAHQGRLFSRMAFGKTRYVILVIEILIAIGLLVRAVTDPTPALLAGLFPLLLAVAFHLSWGYGVRRLERAEAANRALANEFRLGQPPKPERTSAQGRRHGGPATSSQGRTFR